VLVSTSAVSVVMPVLSFLVALATLAVVMLGEPFARV
jgi:hypothetical protein